ncbi:MAG: MarR family transcriptional regulator [Desulfitobacteriaceae bacterium]|nr:MarR family transcriptional regulator [Desulfitobacteriaceae bacterium]MDI6915842.1 MarR family transcriptional regulator [Desulfitobacteriaceae bacterium]
MSTLHETLIDLFNDVQKRLHQYIRPVFQNLSLPPAAMLLARSIAQEPGITVSELSRRTQTAKSHVSNMLEDMSRRGLIEKRPDPDDHRLVRIYLAEQAAEQMQQVREEIRHRLMVAISVVPDDKVVQMIAVLQDFKEALAEPDQE